MMTKEYEWEELDKPKKMKPIQGDLVEGMLWVRGMMDKTEDKTVIKIFPQIQTYRKGQELLITAHSLITEDNKSDKVTEKDLIKAAKGLSLAAYNTRVGGLYSLEKNIEELQKQERLLDRLIAKYENQELEEISKTLPKDEHTREI